MTRFRKQACFIFMWSFSKLCHGGKSFFNPWEYKPLIGRNHFKLAFPDNQSWRFFRVSHIKFSPPFSYLYHYSQFSCSKYLIFLLEKIHIATEVLFKASQLGMDAQWHMKRKAECAQTQVPSYRGVSKRRFMFWMRPVHWMTGDAGGPRKRCAWEEEGLMNITS